jgi:hypothetical protein
MMMATFSMSQFPCREGTVSYRRRHSVKRALG